MQAAAILTGISERISMHYNSGNLAIVLHVMYDSVIEGVRLTSRIRTESTARYFVFFRIADSTRLSSLVTVAHTPLSSTVKMLYLVCSKRMNDIIRWQVP